MEEALKSVPYCFRSIDTIISPWAETRLAAGCDVGTWIEILALITNSQPAGLRSVPAACHDIQHHPLAEKTASINSFQKFGFFLTAIICPKMLCLWLYKSFSRSQSSQEVQADAPLISTPTTCVLWHRLWSQYVIALHRWNYNLTWW